MSHRDTTARRTVENSRPKVFKTVNNSPGAVEKVFDTGGAVHGC